MQLKNIYRLEELPRLACLTIAYLALAHIVLSFSSHSGNVTIFWPPGGLAIAAMLIWGKRYWLPVFVGALLAGIQVGDALPLSLSIAIGNTLESFFAALMLQRLPNFNSSFTRVKHFDIGMGWRCLLGNQRINWPPRITEQRIFNNWQYFWKCYPLVAGRSIGHSALHTLHFDLEILAKWMVYTTKSFKHVDFFADQLLRRSNGIYGLVWKLA